MQAAVNVGVGIHDIDKQAMRSGQEKSHARPDQCHPEHGDPPLVIHHADKEQQADRQADHQLGQEQPDTGGCEGAPLGVEDQLIY